MGWIGYAGRALVVVKGDLAGVPLAPLSAGGIIVLTKELVRSSNERALAFVRSVLVRATVEFFDQAFTDPAAAAVADTSPVSIRNGLTPIASSGTTAEAAIADLRELVAAFVSAGGRLERAALLLSSANATYLALSGHEAFRELTPTGGRAAGIPAFASNGVGSNVVLLDQGRVLMADESDVSFDLPESATLEQSDGPTMHAGDAVASKVVSLWHTNAVAVRILRRANWLALDNAAQYVADADYSGIGSPA